MAGAVTAEGVRELAAVVAAIEAGVAVPRPGLSLAHQGLREAQRGNEGKGYRPQPPDETNRHIPLWVRTQFRMCVCLFVNSTRFRDGGDICQHVYQPICGTRTIPFI